MSVVSYIGISYPVGIDEPYVRISPEHIFSWKFKGVNCATQDYSLGTVSSLDFEFETDLEITFIKDKTLVLVCIFDHNNGDYCGYVTGIERVKNTKNHYHVYVTDRGESLDTPIDESDLTPVENETLTQLVTRLELPFDTRTPYRFNPSVGVNSNYIVNPNWGYSGVTKRDVMRWVCQLQGVNYGGAAQLEYMDGVDIVNWFAPTSIGSGDAFTFTPSQVKSIDKADYMTQPIDKIWFGNDSSDVGLSYGNGEQALLIPTNPLINYEDTSFLQPLYNKVSSLISYTPMKITTYIDNYYYLLDLLHSQQRFWWMSYTEDGITYSCPVFNWEASPSGITLEGTGSPDRTTTNAYLGGEMANAGKFNRFTRTLDETKSEVGNLSGQVSTISQTAASLTIAVADKVGYDEVISSINQTAETITIDADKISLNGAVEVGPSDRHPEAFLTILPSAEDLTGQHSKVQLFNNSIKVHTYDVNNNEIAYSAMEGSGFGQHGITTTNGNRVDYTNVYIFSNAANELNPAGVGYGDIRLYNGKWLQDHGITTTANQGGSVRLAAGNSSEPGGVLQLFDINASGNPSLNARLDASSYGQLVLGNGGGYSGVQATSDTRGVILLRSTSATYPYAYYENNKLQIYSSAATSTLVSPNSVTTYGSTTNFTSLTKDGILVYGDNGSGTAATKGRYTGDSLSVGVAASGTTYTAITPTVITWWNSGYNPVNKLVPQGASVIEHGTKTVGGNTWSYRKWSNGDYECWVAVHYNTQTNHTFGNQYYAEIAAITYPTTFLEAPKEVVSVEGGTQTSSQNISVYLSNASPGTSTTKSGAYLVMRPTNSVVDFWIDYYAKGTVSL